MVDQEKVREGVRLILEGIGEDINREGLIETPDRIARMYCELAGGMDQNAATHLEKRFHVDNADMVQKLVTDTWPEDEELAEIAFRFGIFQRLDYLLHIPTEQMTKDNVFYRNVVKYMRKTWRRAMKNPYLTKKNKCYHTIFTIAPRGIRVLHKKVKHIE